MYIWNQTILVTHAIEAEWLDWMRGEYMPAAKTTAECSMTRLLKLLDMDEEQGVSYAFQLEWPDEQRFQRFLDSGAASLSELLDRRWSASALAFSTSMRTVN